MNSATIRSMTSSKTALWGTPQALYNLLAAEFPMTTDVCALPWNAKCARYFTPEQDGLTQPWTGHCWMNPPYGRAVGAWVKKAYESAVAGDATVVCLLPARVDTTWWHDYCARGEIRVIRGRLRFVAEPHGAYQVPPGQPALFPSAVVIFHAHLDPGGTTAYVDLRGKLKA